MKKLILGIVLALGVTAAASAQCPNCQPQQPAYSQPQQGYMLVRQRRGLFGWHSRWVVVPSSLQPGGAPPVVFIR